MYVGVFVVYVWGVMDVFVNMDFLDWCIKCVINFEVGNILYIFCEGGYFLCMYIDLGEVVEDDDYCVW